MRRILLVVPVITLALLGATSPVAADTLRVVHGMNDFPAGADGYPLGGVGVIGCTDPFQRTTPTGPFISYRRDDTAPLGVRDWQLDAEDGTATALGAYAAEPNADSSTVMSAQFDPTDTTTGAAYAGFVPGSGNDYWVGVATLPAISGGWQTVTSTGLVFHWRRYDSTQQTYVEEGGSSTYATFVSGHGGSGYAEFVLGYGCDGRPFRTDAWTIGNPGQVTTYDLEGALTQITATPTAATVTAGKGVTLGADLRTPGAGAFSSAPLELQARPFGSADFAPVQTVDTGPNGEPATLPVTPLHTTTYRWVYAGSECCEASTSDPVTVKVRTAVTAALADATVRTGRTLTLAGRTTPAKPGAAVTMYRKTATGKQKLAGGKVGSDGRYHLSTKATSKGSWKVFAVVAAGSGNLAGTSPVRTAKVS